MAQFILLDQAAEDKLHSTRLLNIEERPFKRITKRLLASSTPIASYLTRTPSSKATSQNNATATDEPTSDPPAEPSSSTSAPTTLTTAQQDKYLKDLSRFREDIILDFAAFDSSIARIQFLHLANAKQRQRYTDEKISIQSTSDAVRADMERLKVTLEEAQKNLTVRKGYDVLAERIVKNRDLVARDEQAVNIERLRAEIEELEREGVELGNAWVERREQFARLGDEGLRLRRVVRGEPEPRGDGDGDDDDDDHSEGEHDEGGDGDGDEGEGGRSDVDGDENMLGLDEQRDRDGNSHMGTPLMRPDDAPTPLPGLHESSAMTPRSMLGEAEVSTPRPETLTSKIDENNAGGKEGIPEVKVDDMDMT